ncbi:ABC-type transport auxiliary lipoprotein family protein [Sphingomonas melonis]|jgi:cholesterol transport system auxiliary component|uniref:Cholesterol transport system auxiliary component n=1 Tax=Sphingomonas melonis TaxID=152682 RepID=A0A7Y9FSZ6_9SPHN|nr:ABC-type transport auxiliary lipoprotein family protein [Sphingomonas melonis]NYD91711.1 cholesterol transport system auxiliary component [Sphingomonas melonis]
MKTKLLLLAAALPLAGCISFGAKPPPSLLTLDATSAPAVGADQNSAKARSITIQVPATPTAIAGGRVPVQATPTTIAYVKDAQWAEPPARLFARLLADTVSARSNMVVLSTVQSIGDPSATLAGDLRRFGLDASTREAVVTYDGALTRAGKETVEKRRFEARVPVSAIDAANAGSAISQAANQVAVEVAAWVATN